MSQNNRVKLSKRFKKSKFQGFKVLRKEDADHSISVASRKKPLTNVNGRDAIGISNVSPIAIGVKPLSFAP